jgi:hypothetical protein
MFGRGVSELRRSTAPTMPNREGRRRSPFIDCAYEDQVSIGQILTAIF